MTAPTIDWSAAGETLRAELHNALAGLVTGSASSISRYAEQIVAAALVAAETGDQVTKDSIGRQVRMLAHQHELMARRVGWDFVESLILSVVRAGVGTVLAAVPIPPRT